MRWSFGLVGLVLAVLLVSSAGIARAYPSHSQAAKKDSVTGGFHDIYGFNNGVQASSGPSGEDPTGHASATSPTTGDKIREDAVCVAVSGNLAAVGMVGTQNGEPYSEVQIFRDGGPGGSGDGFDAFTGEDPYDCVAFVDDAENAPAILKGNILVKDATP